MTLQELLVKRIESCKAERNLAIQQGNAKQSDFFSGMLSTLELLRDEAIAKGAFLTGTFEDPRVNDGPMMDVDGRDVTANGAAGHNKIGIHAWKSSGPEEHIFMETAQVERLIACLSATVMWDKGNFYFGDDGKVVMRSQERVS